MRTVCKYKNYKTDRFITIVIFLLANIKIVCKYKN